MRNPSAIELRRVSKRFVIHHNKPTTLKERILRSFSERTKDRSQLEIFWALKDVSLQVARGETVGLIGLNGSGKSTLLRLIAKILVPTEGEVIVRGKVAPMTELGLGFHQELTGEENIYLSASLYGLSRREIRVIYEEIVEFSELSHFIDVPVKNYSSGMYARLGFSIAVHLDPEILLIDEVLAVGDERFQKKCFDKMQELKRKGKTIAFVSHEMKTVQKLCDRAYLLEQGRIASEGSVELVAARYRNLQTV